MTDAAIINLYWQRSDEAIRETDAAYGPFCYSLAYSLLNSREDSEESVSDTYMAAWNAMPPDRPDCLKAYLGRITRRISVSRLRRRLSQKRGGGETALAIEELAECVPGPDSTACTVELRELTEHIERFLYRQSEQERQIFLARYWYTMAEKDIALRLGLSLSGVKSSLYRTRRKLRDYLKEEGLC